ncbi:MAG: DUF3006 domain-containing protein [Bacteroidetes bacterium]|nr:DUF3006 domain-containing protein [Bacteroidota bacterium]
MAEKARLWATVDRIVRDHEGKDHAVLVLDNGQQLVLPVEALPPGAQPQQVVTVEFRIDPEETSRRAGQVEQLQQQLFGEVERE